MKLSDEDLDRLEALERESTLGPWKWWGKYFKYLVGAKPHDVILQEIGLPGKGMLSPEKEDAEFIVASRTAIPDLLSDLRESQARVKDLERRETMFCVTCQRRIIVPETKEGA